MVVSYCVNTGRLNLVLWKNGQPVLVTAEPYLQLGFFYFNFYSYIYLAMLCIEPRTFSFLLVCLLVCFVFLETGSPSSASAGLGLLAICPSSDEIKSLSHYAWTSVLSLVLSVLTKVIICLVLYLI